jgi:hypothetical protein
MNRIAYPFLVIIALPDQKPPAAQPSWYRQHQNRPSSAGAVNWA